MHLGFPAAFLSLAGSLLKYLRITLRKGANFRNFLNDVLFLFGKVERKDTTMDFLNSVLEPSL